MSLLPIRRAKHSDLAQLAPLRAALWPDSSAQEHAQELELILAGKFPGILPLVIFVSEASGGGLLGFIEVGLRSHADGCDQSHPVGFIEGWFVAEGHRRQGSGAALVRAAEDWARSQGCLEMASDTQIENLLSQRAHAALGYEIAERCILYRKRL
jgi:aminoglycoside 6'-N-acetyltransferase I